MIKFYSLGTIENHKLKIVVILSKYRNNYIFVKHKKRNTWEIPEGHREKKMKLLKM